MKIYQLLLAFMIFFAACGKEDKWRGNCAAYGEDCHPEDDKDQPRDTGPQGPEGPQGPRGKTGNDGLNSLITFDRLDSGLGTCTADSGMLIRGGLDINGDGFLDAEEVTQLSYLCDGSDGNDGSNAPYAVTEIIDPCGKQASFDEVLLRMANGTILAHYASGANQYLTVLGAGNWVTTDGTQCYFTLNAQNQISNEHN